MNQIVVVTGARPNFMKVDPILRELKRLGIPAELVHTGQHYDANMSEVFFGDLGLPEPDVYLGVGSASHAKQTAAVMAAFDDYCASEKPDWVIVVGDVNSTIACALAYGRKRERISSGDDF